MTQRIVQFELAQVLEDPEAVEAALNAATRRDGKRYWISGVCQAGSRIVFPLEEVTDSLDRRYVLRELLGSTPEDLIADVVGHWQSSHSTRGVVSMPDCLFGLFERATPAVAPALS